MIQRAEALPVSRNGRHRVSRARSDELDFPFERATRFEDLETGEEIMAVPELVRAQYMTEISSLVDRYRRELARAASTISCSARSSRSSSRCCLIFRLEASCCEATYEHSPQSSQRRRIQPLCVFCVLRGDRYDMLSFLSPFFLVGLAAAAVPIVLHLLKRAPEPRVRFGAVQLLRRAG